MSIKPTIEYSPAHPRPAKGEPRTLRLIEGGVYRATTRCWVFHGSLATERIRADLVIDAARVVVARWETGDLAEAVRELDKALHAHDKKEYKP